eukprot:GHVT01016433.1.p1 GENE.GHVT01016433.1~~GHVT01016433.1.p1  ORF type:complete len:139 (-),score=17.56 GHVT01016433.1:272-688(-)
MIATAGDFPLLSRGELCPSCLHECCVSTDAVQCPRPLTGCRVCVVLLTRLSEVHACEKIRDASMQEEGRPEPAQDTRPASQAIPQQELERGQHETQSQQHETAQNSKTNTGQETTANSKPHSQPNDSQVNLFRHSSDY